LATGTSKFGAWTKQALLAEDENNGFDFEAASTGVRILLRETWPFGSYSEVNTAAMSRRTRNFSTAWIKALYCSTISTMGRGGWGVDLLRSEECQTLTNGLRLPLVISMTCLSGYFIDVYTESLAEALLKAKQGARWRCGVFRA